MDATKFLKQDHDELKKLFTRLDATQDEERIEEIYDELERLILAHTQIEEELFYPAARTIAGLDVLIEESLAAHNAVDALCDEIAEAEVGDEAFLGRLEALKDLLLHHIEEEENDLFPRFEQGFDKDQLADLGKRLEARKDEICEKEPAEA
jgi:hemerythrin superfamily protein